MSCVQVAGMLAAVSVALAAPLCRSSEGIQGRFPLFAPTYDMQSSTIIQPCNMTGFLEPAEFYAQSSMWTGFQVSPPVGVTLKKSN